MKFRIFKIINNSLLNTIDNTTNYYPTTIYRQCLEELDIRGIETIHDTMELAYKEIKEHSKDLKFETLTILPIIEINYDGEIEK